MCVCVCDCVIVCVCAYSNCVLIGNKIQWWGIFILKANPLLKRAK